ncbi:LOW QUALITY PROTEIN: mediator of RNA polymerase II transcription subunit 7b [Raphanus sativus]|uniref:Mediator of RNA polymerase II transcription subunit 7 n=1 Tax=Raphanus sativus TaxID=3726 RepID=A0A9W3C3Z6_RAPSA|nr:LOW QUALITY PROTEIN: mediator of RNA polymerase II transcription subunit 7b [Raphanus sativus]
MATATYLPPPFYKDHSENRSYVPEPPSSIEGTYVCFGGNYIVTVHSLTFHLIKFSEDVLPNLEEQGVVPQIYPKDSNVDYKKELRSLNRELQLHVLELADVLVERPSQYAKRIGDISSIFKNLHHLLDSLRPQQARATLIHIMELQFQQRKQAVEDIKRRREVQRLLKDAFITLDGQ